MRKLPNTNTTETSNHPAEILSLLCQKTQKAKKNAFSVFKKRGKNKFGGFNSEETKIANRYLKF